MSLLTIGTVALDKLETPFGKTEKIVGGSCSFASLSASYLYKKVNIVAVVGGDFPKSFIDTLNKKGINTTGLQIKEDEKSFFWSNTTTT